MSRNPMTPAAALVGVALVGSLGALGPTSAADNPFVVKTLDGGYLQLAGADGEGKCGEGKCGGAKGTEGTCGEDKGKGEKGTEGKCGEGKCGGTT